MGCLSNKKVTEPVCQPEQLSTPPSPPTSLPPPKKRKKKKKKETEVDETLTALAFSDKTGTGSPTL